MSGSRPRKRDFRELAAKLDKHIDRLPDYAERAQRQLQRYRARQEHGHRPPARRPAPPPTRTGENLPVKLPDMSMVNEAREQWVRWNAPAAKLERRKRRTSRALTLWIVLTILCGIAAVAGAVGAAGAASAVAAALTPVVGVVVFGTLAVRSGLRLRELKRTTLPATATRVALPAQSSAAYEPMERLGKAEAALAELLRQLSAPPMGAVASVPEVSIADARATSAEAAGALRALAGRLQAIERARDASPDSERGALDAAVRALGEQLDDGLEDYGGLVAAAGRAVAASAGGVDASRRALTDATDRLAGLAIALRELS